jgi:hypothetical protein
VSWLRKHEHERAVKEWQRAEQAWEVEGAELQSFLDLARTFNGLIRTDDPRIALELHADECVYWVGQGASLIEPRRLPGQWQGGYSGFSFRIAKGVRWHVGGTRGHTVPGAEVPTPIDTGSVTITDRRVVFQGTKHVREWDYERLLGYQHDPTLPWTAIQVSNRKKVSGVLYDREHAEEFHFRLALGLAHFHHDVDGLVQHVQAEIADHDRRRPAPPPPASSARS